MPDPVRLTVALEALGALPQGRCAVFRARAGADLSPLARDIHVIQGFRPDYDWFDASMVPVDVVPDDHGYASALVCLPRSREEGRDLIARAMDLLPVGAPVLVDGYKVDGVEGVLRSCRKYIEGTSEAVSKAHGKTFRVPAGPPPESFRAPERRVEGFATPAGAFGAGKIDAGSAFLAAVLPAGLPAHVVDLGAGWGFLAARALEADGIERIDLVEAEHVALEAARGNVPDPRAAFHWADARTWRPDAPADLVLTNPPFHEGRQADAALGMAFIDSAAAMLAPKGRLLMVANRHLPYEAHLADRFASVAEIAGDPRFKVIEAARPRRL